MQTSSLFDPIRSVLKRFSWLSYVTSATCFAMVGLSIFASLVALDQPARYEGTLRDSLDSTTPGSWVAWESEFSGPSMATNASAVSISPYVGGDFEIRFDAREDFCSTLENDFAIPGGAAGCVLRGDGTESYLAVDWPMRKALLVEFDKATHLKFQITRDALKGRT